MKQLITTGPLPLLLMVWLAVGGLTPKAFGQEQKVLLAIFAHPDDEASVSPILTKYAREGVQVYLAIAADGRYGAAGSKGLRKSMGV